MYSCHLSLLPFLPYFCEALASDQAWLSLAREAPSVSILGIQSGWRSMGAADIQWPHWSEGVKPLKPQRVPMTWEKTLFKSAHVPEFTALRNPSRWARRGPGSPGQTRSPAHQGLRTGNITPPHSPGHGQGAAHIRRDCHSPNQALNHAWLTCQPIPLQKALSS